MDDTELDIPMPENYRSTLMKIIKLAKEQKTLSFRLTLISDEILVGVGKAKQFSVRDEWTGNIFHALSYVGLLAYTESETTSFQPDFVMSRKQLPRVEIKAKGSVVNKWTYYLTTKAFHWYDYQKKNWVGRWFARRSVKDIALVFSIVVSLVSLTVSILSAIDLAQKLKLIP